jgi:tetratricopeptide (TPR) repeat protein
MKKEAGPSRTAHRRNSATFRRPKSGIARLAIKEKQDKKHAPPTYHQLGRIAAEQRDFKAAEEWCRKSLAIQQSRATNRRRQHLSPPGQIAQAQRDFKAAEDWYRKSLASRKAGQRTRRRPHLSPPGHIAEEQRDFKAAEEWYQNRWRF